MPQQTKIFRVFVSSTFTDMKEERRILQKEVFPKLEAFCEKNNAKFQAVDLRWGVTEESQLNQKTVDICLNEIWRCQKITPKPNFVVLMGDRYGWQPIPAKIPDKDMKAILPELTPEQEKLIDTWYKLDTNAVPAEYVLQPRGKEYEAYKDWEKVETAIREVLRETVNKLKFLPEQRIKYFASATHQEIIEGALNPRESQYKTEEHVIAMVRETRGLPKDQTAKGFIDLKDGQPDSDSEKQLAELKNQLKQKLGPHYISSPAEWKKDHSEMADPEAFAKQVCEFLQEIIEEQIREVISPDEIDHEMNLHGEFREKLTEHFCGRDEILKSIASYLSETSEKKTLSLIGASGSGKSSVMAKAAELAEEKNEKALTGYRFIGVSSSSSNIISLLQSVSGQIARSFNTTLEALAGEGREKAIHDINGVTDIFKKSLALATAEKPVVLFMDALDQLSDADNARALHWLPKVLPDHVKVVVSALPELEANLSGTLIQQLPLLPEKDAKTILDRWLESISRKLENDQEKLVINKFSKTKLPIFLKLAFEQVRHWHSYDKKQLSDDVQGIINDFIGGLEKEHTPEFVEHAISYMLCGRYQGLAENEILEILVFDKEFWEDVFLKKMTHPDFKQELIDLKKEMESSKTEPKRAMKIPIVLWSRLFLDLEPFLTERDADGVPIIVFFHRQFNEVLRERYGLVES
jgi:hypothetical protein